MNVISTSAFQPVPYLAVYGASKAFLLSLTEAMATELAGYRCRRPGALPRAHRDRVPGRGRHRPRALQPHRLDDAGTPSSPHPCAPWSAGRLRVVPGLSNRLTAALVPFTPGWLVRRIGAKLFQPSPQGH